MYTIPIFQVFLFYALFNGCSLFLLQLSGGWLILQKMLMLVKLHFSNCSNLRNVVWFFGEYCFLVLSFVVPFPRFSYYEHIIWVCLAVGFLCVANGIYWSSAIGFLESQLKGNFIRCYMNFCHFVLSCYFSCFKC